jgi:hypothetical protein
MIAVLISLGIGILGLAIWIAFTLAAHFPMVILPVATGVAIGFVVRRALGTVSNPIAIGCAIIAAILSIIGNMITTVLMGGSSDKTTTTISDMIAFLSEPDYFWQVFKLTLTPMDILIVLFVGGASYYMSALPFQPAESTEDLQDLPMASPIPLHSDDETKES